MRKIIPKYKNIILTISYGDYTNGKGGTDRVIKAHQTLLDEKDISILHLFCQNSIGEKVHLNRTDLWRMLIDGKDNGLFSTKGIINTISDFQKEEYHLLSVFIHHLNNVNILQLKYLLNCIDSNIFFYIHDYFTICPATGLITENGTYCGTETPNPLKCDKCSCFNKALVERVEEIQGLFDDFRNRLTFIAPSQTAKNIWLITYPHYKDKTFVIPHQKLLGSYDGNKEIKSNEQALNIAFVGYQRALKGWDIWYDAVNKIHQDVNYNFFQLGTVTTHVDFVKEVKVDFTEDLNSMISQLRANAIDVAVLWSLCPETYSYTLFEAMAANTFVLTNNESGNIASQVKKNGNGIIADSIFDLEGLLADEKTLREKVNRFKKNDKYGPLVLKENDDFLSFMNYEGEKPCEHIRSSMVDNIYLLFCNQLLKLYKVIKRK